MMTRNRRLLCSAHVLAAFLVGSAPGPVAAVDFEADYSGQIHAVAQTGFPSSARCLDVEGHFAFVGTYNDGIQIVDLSDPLAPALVGSAAVPDHVNDVAVRAGVLYVSTQTAGVFLFDVTRPDDPVLLGSAVPPGYSRGLALSPDTGPARFVFVAGDWRGVHVIDVGVPSAPVVIEELDTDEAHTVAYRNGTLYVADNEGGMLVVDAGDPGDLHVVDVLDQTGTLEVHIAGSRLYAGGWDFFRIYDISDPAAPVLLGHSTIGSSPGNGYAVSAIHVEDDVALLAANNQGLYLADVSDPEDPVVFFGLHVSYTPDVDRMGPWIVVAHAVDGQGMLRIVDSRGRPSPVPIGSTDLGGTFGGADVAVSGGTAYTMGQELRIHDVSDPTAPTTLGVLPIPSGAGQLAMAGPDHLIFTKPTTSDLSVVDVGDPTSPELVASLEPDEVFEMYGLDVVGRYAYLSARMRPASSGGLLVVDLLDLANPTVVAALDVADLRGKNVRVVGDIAYVVTGFPGLVLVDVSTPTLPVVLSTLDIGGASDIRIRDGFAYVAVDYQGLKTVDVSDPFAPHVVCDGVEGIYRASDVELDGNYAYVSCLSWGVNVVDISDPAAPVLLGATMVPPDQIGFTQALAFENGLIYSSGDAGLAILPRQAGAGTEALAAPAATASGPSAVAYPNPFRSNTTLAFGAPATGNARVAVYDVTGRLVRVLLNERVDAGRQRIRWDGMDESGRPTVSGVYFVRLDVGSEATVRKIQRLR